MADDALAVLDAADAASAHVYGVSLGGAIALPLALDHPGRVRSLTFINGKLVEQPGEEIQPEAA